MAKSLQAIKALDPSKLTKMTKKEIESYLRPAAKIVKTRMNKLDARGIASPATAIIENRGGIKTKGTRAQLIKELAAARRFLLSETGTIKGATKFVREMRQRLNISRTKLSKTEMRELWNFISEVEEITPGIGSDVIQRISSEIYVERRRKRYSQKDKDAIWESLTSSERFSSMVTGIDRRKISDERWRLYETLLRVDKEYRGTQHAADFFSLT